MHQLDRARLAQIGREYMLAAQFNSRTGYAALQMNHGPEAYLQVAIDNWMAVSPIYSQRIQRAMRTNTGSDIATILKGLQLECGMSHQYFDAGMEEVSAREGYFWLNSCGPLLETEPRGEAAVKTMCHDVEDPTFDATAVATNPRARVRPVHRPPRVPADRVPHCKWRVTIEPDAEPLEEPALTGVMRRTVLAGLEIERRACEESGGLDYYDGPLVETLQLERFSKSALVVICKELAVQIHLLLNALGHVIGERYGAEAGRAVSVFQFSGAGWVISERLARVLGHDQGGIDAIVDVLRVHPAFQPVEYFGIEVVKTGEDSARICFGPGAASQEAVALGWYPLLQAGDVSGLEALLRGVDPGVSLAPAPSGGMAWDIRVGVPGATVEEPLSVQIAKGTVLYSAKLEDHIELIQV